MVFGMDTDSRQEFFSAIRTGNKRIVSLISQYPKEWKNTSDENSCTSLHLAAENGQIEIAEYLISMGADIEAKDKWGKTPFLTSCYYGQEGVMNFLVKNGCNSNAKTNIETGALGLVSEKGHVVIARKLVEMGFDVNETNNEGMTPLHWASAGGHVELAEYLISIEANLEAKKKTNVLGGTPFLEAVLNGQEGMMKLLIKNGCNLHAKTNHETGALGLASSEGHVAIVRKLIEMDFDVSKTNSDGMTPLHWASWGGHVEVAKYLISTGANLEAKDKLGRTPFLEAVFNGQEDVMKLLIENGCNIYAKNNVDNGALGFASLHGHIVITRKLIEMGLDVNETNIDGVTLLHWASWGGHVEVAEYLISIGANLEAKDKWGRTPFLQAVSNGQEGVMNLLIKNGCNINAENNHKTGALGLASWKGHVLITRKLIEMGFDVNETDSYGFTSLHWASWGHIELAEYLISIGANLEAKNEWGRTPFLEAVLNGQEGVMNLLIKNGCNIHAKDNDNEGALSIAHRQNLPEIRKKLLMTMVKKVTKQANHSEVLSSFALEDGHASRTRSLLGISAEKSNLRQSVPLIEECEEISRLKSQNERLLEELESVWKELESAKKFTSEMQLSLKEAETQRDWAQKEMKKGNDELQAALIGNAAELNVLRERLETEQKEKAQFAVMLAEGETSVHLMKRERDTARLLAEEAIENLSKYEGLLQIPLSDIKMSDVLLGGGSYGEVRVGCWRGCDVAVKTFFDFLRVDQYQKRLEQEISICHHVHHPNVVSLFGVITQDGIPLSIVSELLEGSLSDVINAAFGKLSLREQVDLAIGFSAGITYLHGLDILHGDIRSTNVVVTALMEAKICDLGAARFAENSALSAGPMSPNYVAPERPRFGSTKEADVYSLGVTLIELMTGEEPVREKRISQAVSVLHQAIKDLSVEMVAKDPIDRPSARSCQALLETIRGSDRRYKGCPSKRMVKGKRYGGDKVELVKEMWV